MRVTINTIGLLKRIVKTVLAGHLSKQTFLNKETCAKNQLKQRSFLKNGTLLYRLRTNFVKFSKATC